MKRGRQGKKKLAAAIALAFSCGWALVGATSSEGTRSAVFSTASAEITVNPNTHDQIEGQEYYYGGLLNGEVSNKTIKVSGGEDGDILKSGANDCGVVGGHSLGDAKNNTVTIDTKGTIPGSVYGGWSYNGGIAEGNMVNISSGKVTGGGFWIYGGSSKNGDATGNTIRSIFPAAR